MPRVSVLMPVRNVEKYIDASVQSILGQTCGDFEILIADDASTDNTWVRLQALARSDERIRLYRNEENRGIANTLNFLVDEARGEYIARMDGDDVSIPSRFERQLEVLGRGRVDICGGWIMDFGMGVKRIVRSPRSHGEIAMHLLFRCALMHPTIMMKRQVFNSTRYRAEASPAEDYDCWVRALRHNTMCNLPYVLVARRLHVGQISSKAHSEQAEAGRKASLLALADKGIFPTPEEHRIHLNFYCPMKHIHSDDAVIPDKWNDVIATRAWVEKLTIKLSKDRCCIEFLAKHWYMYCLCAASFGPKTYGVFHAYSPDGSKKNSLGKRVIVFTLCLFHIRYHSSLYNFLSVFRKETRINRRIERASVRTMKNDIGNLMFIGSERSDHLGISSPWRKPIFGKADNRRDAG